MIIDGGEAKDIYISGLRVRRIQMFGETVYELASALSIEGPSEYSGKYFLLSAYQDNQKVYPQTWSITSGTQYATINSNGRVDINSNTSTQQNITVTATYGNATASKTIGVLYDTEFIIVCADTITGTSGNYQVFYDGNDVTSTATITITSGTATVSSGDITFNASGSLTFYATYNGFTSQPKTTMLVYNSNAETETTVDPDTGETTTTTTITETDPQAGETTTSTTTTVTQEDGSESTTNSETVTQTDGSSSTNSTTTNSDGTSSETTSTTSAPDPDTGSVTSNSTTTNYDENGDTTGSSTNTTVENTDGSSTSSTTNYDAEGDPTDQTNQATDTQGNVDTQDVVFDDQGDPTVVGYTIDTSNNPEGTKDITGDGVNTEFIPFDGTNGFEIHIKFKSRKQDQPNPPLVVDTEDTGSNYHFTILCSKSPFSPWPGFHIRWTLNKNNYSSGNLVFGYKDNKEGTSSTNRNLALSKHNDLYEYLISYDPYLEKYPSKFRCQDLLNGAATISLNINFIPLEYPLTLGYNISQAGTPYRYSNVEILEFSINKLEV